MNVAAMRLGGRGVTFDVSLDVNETAAIVYDAKRRGGKSGVWILGGGSPKNFMLQTEPQIQEVLGLDEKGHDYFLQVTDARPDTGGLSGATPSEAVLVGEGGSGQAPRYRSSATSTPPWRCRSSAPSRSTGWESARAGASTTAGRR